MPLSFYIAFFLCFCTASEVREVGCVFLSFYLRLEFLLKLVSELFSLLF